MNRPIPILVIVGVLALQLITTFVYTAWYKIDVLYILLNYLGFGYAHFLFTIPQLIALAIAIPAIWFKKPLGYYAALASIIVLLVYSTFGVSIRIGKYGENVEALTQNYTHSYSAATQQDIYDFQAALLPNDMVYAYMTILGFIVLVTLLLQSQRGYFFSKTNV